MAYLEIQKDSIDISSNTITVSYEIWDDDISEEIPQIAKTETLDIEFIDADGELDPTVMFSKPLEPYAHTFYKQMTSNDKILKMLADDKADDEAERAEWMNDRKRDEFYG